MTAVGTLRRAARIAAAVALAAWIVTTAGCAAHTVPVYRRERLVDRIMAFEKDAKKDARLTKSFDAREGSTGGNGGSGGGCACN